MVQWVREADYKAYILRIWKESEQWRFSIEAIGSGRRQGFAHIEQVAAFLEEVAPAVEEADSVEM